MVDECAEFYWRAHTLRPPEAHVVPQRLAIPCKTYHSPQVTGTGAALQIVRSTVDAQALGRNRPRVRLTSTLCGGGWALGGHWRRCGDVGVRGCRYGNGNAVHRKRTCFRLPHCCWKDLNAKSASFSTLGACPVRLARTPSTVVHPYGNHRTYTKGRVA